METSLTDLPPNVITEILSRLPLTTLFASKCVCKTFLHLSSHDNPHFTALLAANASQLLIFQCAGDYVGEPLSLFTVDHEAYFIATDDAPPDNPKLGNLYKLPCCTGVDYFLQQSCNGLIFSKGKEVRIGNPVTNEYIIFPHSDTERMCGVYLGFCPSSKKYKVLKFITPVTGLTAKILEVGSDSWKCIDNSRPVNGHMWGDSHSFLDGCMYWMNGLSHHYMDFFNFETERFGVVELPQSEGVRVNCNGACVSTLQGCLCLSTCDLSRTKVTIWILKRGNQTNWKMAYVVDLPDHMRNFKLYSLMPVKMLLNSEILMKFDYEGGLICYNVESKSLRYVVLGDVEMLNASGAPEGVAMMRSLVVFTPSVVPLKDILMVDDSLVKKASEGWRMITDYY